MKKGFTVIEIIVAVFILAGIASFAVPAIMDNTAEAKLVTTWRDLYLEVKYVFSIIEVQRQENEELFKMSLSKVPTSQKYEVEKAYLLSMLRPSLRLKKGVDNTVYKPLFISGATIPADSPYYFDSYFFGTDHKIIGLRWDKNCQKSEICGKISFDINGNAPPNAWGKDIFGVSFKDTIIRPLGEEVGAEGAKEQCLINTQGVECSYYYLLGGTLD